MSHNTQINTTYIIEPSISLTGGSGVISACTAVVTDLLVSCSGDTEIVLGNGYIGINNSIIPNIDVDLSIGSEVKRFRDINTYSGTSTIWVSENKIETPNLDLGLDSAMNNRQITANNSIIQNDVLNGGTF